MINSQESSTNPVASDVKKEKYVVLKWIVASFLLLGSFSQPLSIAIISILLSLFICPLTYKLIIVDTLKKTFDSKTKWGIVVVTTIFTTLIMCIGRVNTTTVNAGYDTVNRQASPTYEILYESQIRYDKAPCYYVLVDTIDVNDDKFILKMKTIVNSVTTEKGTKIDIEIFDDVDALYLYYNSHYGINKLGRILNKKEVHILKKHHIASFSGEFELGEYENSLYILPHYSPTEKNTSRVYEYTPHM